MPWLMWKRGVLDPTPIVNVPLVDAQALALKHHGITLEWSHSTPPCCSMTPLGFNSEPDDTQARLEGWAQDSEHRP